MVYKVHRTLKALIRLQQSYPDKHNQIADIMVNVIKASKT